MSETKRERGTGRIFVRGTTAWIQFYDSRGAQVRESTGITTDSENWEKQAERSLRKKIGAVANGIDPDPAGLRYEDLRDAYLRNCVNDEHKSLPKKADGSLILGDDDLPKMNAVSRCDDFFSGYRSRDIRSELLDRFVEKLKREGYGNGSINRSLSALRAMFSLARKREVLRDVPAHYPLLPESKPRQGYFEHAEYKALLAALPAELKPLLAIGYYTGMRSGEIRGLRWTQIDFLNGVIRLNPGETKNNQGRVAPMTGELAAILRIERSRCPKDFPFVCFRINRSGQPERVQSFRRAWRTACVKLGLGEFVKVTDPVTGEVVFAVPRVDRKKARSKPKLTYEGRLFHDLRRTGVRNLVRSGVPQNVAQSISGHRTASVFSRYNITSEQDVVDAARKLERFVQAQEQKVRGQNGDNLNASASANQLSQ